MGKIKIDKEDKTRVILTELLPYEVPLLFSNEGFYNIIKNNELTYFKQKIDSIYKIDYALPFNYEIKKNIIGDTRLLSIIHPFIQLKFIELFEKYDSLMLNLCSKSPISLRGLHKIAKFYYTPTFVFSEENIVNPDREVEAEIADAESQFIKSYFTYKPVDLIYKFYDRNEFQRLEQRYNYLMEFDISKCFYNIYTHSVTWAVKDKDSAKVNSRKNTFENKFDKLMQQANYNETNGIVVGPEISRIFAEIILQQVDLNILNKINKLNSKFGIDYDIRRYVDDYFVFSNNLPLLEQIQKIVQKELQYYKLYLNPQKNNVKISPFISDITVGKFEIRDYLVEFYNSLFEVRNDDTSCIIQINKPYVLSQKFIKKFQVIVVSNNLTYDTLSKDCVRFFKSKIVDLLKNEEKLRDLDRAENFFLMIIDIVLYCYSVNINTNTTFRVSQMIILIIKYFQDKIRPDIKNSVFSKLYRDSEFILTNFHRKQVRHETSIETINLILALKKLGPDYQFSPKKIAEFFNIDDDHISNLNYFHFITLLYYFNDDSLYSDLKEIVTKEIIRRFEKHLVFLNSELTMLFFDFVSCPYVRDEYKIQIMKLSKYVKTGSSRAEILTEIDKIKLQKKWFMNWGNDVDLERILKKKEWTTSY